MARSQTNTARLEGLRPGMVYVVQVRARTVAGYGKYSGKMCFQTLTDGECGWNGGVGCSSLVLWWDSRSFCAQSSVPVAWRCSSLVSRIEGACVHKTVPAAWWCLHVL